MKAEALALLALILLAAVALQPALCQVEPGKDFESAPAIDLSSGSAPLNGSLTGAFEDNHFYRLVGISSGEEIRVEGTLTGIETGLTTVVLYSPEGARLTGSDQVLGKGSKKKVSLSYTPAYDPDHPQLHLYLRIGKSRGALNYTLQVRVEPRFDADSGRDAGAGHETAVETPVAKPGEPATFQGYLTEKDSGNDYQDFYLLKAQLQPGQILRISVDPERSLRVKAILLSNDLFSLRHNQSESRGEPITMSIQGDWEPGLNKFYLSVDNLGGRGGGGSYTVRVEVQQPPAETETTTYTPSSPFSEETMRLLLITVAVALVAVAIAVLVIRRRRGGIKVVSTGEEWGWGEEGEEW